MCGGKGEQTGAAAMIPKEGDIFISTLDEEEYRVMQIVNYMVVLESKDGKKQIMTGIDCLGSFPYQKKEDSKT
jgi:hypothetical protein